MVKARGGKQVRGRTLLLVSREMSPIPLVGSRVVCLDEGRVIDDGDPTDVIARCLGEMGTFEPPIDPPAQICSCLIPDHLELGNGLEIEADIEIVRPLLRPQSGVEMIMAFNNPDVVHTVSNERVPGLVAPGTHRLRSRSDTLGWRNTTIRFNLDLRDGSLLVDRAWADCRLPNDSHPNLYAAMEPDLETMLLDEAVADAMKVDVAAHGPSIVDARNVTKTYRRGRSNSGPAHPHTGTVWRSEGRGVARHRGRRPDRGQRRFPRPCRPKRRC